MSKLPALPSEWKIATLGSMADIDKRSLNGHTSDDFMFRYIDISSVSENHITKPNSMTRFAEAPSRARRVVKPGDVLMSTVRPNLRAFARFCFDDADYIASTGFAVLSAKNGNDGRFILQSILSDDVGRQIESLIVGSNYPAINSTEVRDLLVARPPIPEQRKIAEILGSVDENIEKTQALIAKLQDLKKAAMQELLTKGIGHTKFKDSPVGRIPEEWEIVELRAVCKKVTDGAHTSVRTAETGVPFLYISCVRDGQILWDEAAYVSEEDYITISKGREPIPGLILYTAVGSYGNAALVTDDRRFTFQRHIAYILPDEKKISPRYLVCWMNSPMCKRHADIVALGNAQKTVTLGSLAEFPVPLPTLSEQEHIADCLDAVDANIQSKKRRLEKLNHTKKALMQDLLTGKVRVKV